MRDTNQLVEQRIRNRIFDWLDTVASSEEGKDLNELINQWDDWTNNEPVSKRFSAPTFTADELSSLGMVQSEIEKFCETTPDILTSEHWPQWLNVKNSSKTALSCFSIRGTLPEEEAPQQ